MLVLVEIGEYFGALFRPYLVVEKQLSGEELLKMFIVEGFFTPDENVEIDYNNLTMVFKSSKQYLKINQRPIPSLVEGKIKTLEKRVEELEQLCRCYRQEEQAYYGQHR